MRPQTKSKALLMAYERGRSAARMGLPFSVCPYTSGEGRSIMVSAYYKFWQRGWSEGKSELVGEPTESHHR